ncbi:MAG: proton-conducting transporter membrane subunit, partial [Chloroflexi bacterium]|nr:proton-conducting transporter membrane subunit [Chloroflexota bacterium]
KRLIAYSSVSHMGFVMLGISSVGGVAGSVSSVGLNGAAMQMFTHGTITGLLFVVAGLIYERTHTRHIPDLGGLASQMPFTAAVFVVAGLASLGLPGLSGFVSEVLVFIGAFSVWAWPTAAAVIGIILAAGYILWMIQRVLTGPSLERYAQVKEVTIVEAVPMVVLVVAIVVVGLYPGVLIDSFDAAIAPIILEMQFP